ncbi:MAG TPA: glycoside hydrolase family 25 protein [Longimicrobium sp.]
MLNAVIDLYRKDSVESWDAVKGAGIHAIIHKATQGTGYVDEKYAKRRAATVERGFLWGAYHFGDASDPQKQARHFLDTVKSVEASLAAQLGHPPAPPPLLVLDLEENFLEPSNSMSIGKAEKFVTYVQEQTGRFPGLYAGDDLRSMLNGHPNQTLARCWLWLADWREKPRLIAGWNEWTLWQYTDGGNGPEPRSCAGVSTCNRTQFNGDLTGLRKLFGASA